jgi:hypothetical protein
MNDEQLNNWFNDIFESIATLSDRVSTIEQTMNWQRELAMREISRMGQEQEYEEALNPNKYENDEWILKAEREHARSLVVKELDDLSPETRASVEEGLEQARRGEFVRGPDLDECAKLIEAMDMYDIEREIEFILQRRCPDHDYHMDVEATAKEIMQLLDGTPSSTTVNVRGEERDVSEFEDDGNEVIEVAEDDDEVYETIKDKYIARLEAEIKTLLKELAPKPEYNPEDVAFPKDMKAPEGCRFKDKGGGWSDRTNRSLYTKPGVIEDWKDDK